MTEDDQLMIRIQSGDRLAFEELVDRYQSALIGFFIRNVRDRQLSEDLTQDTLLRVYTQAWHYLPLGKFRGWMYRVARNLMIDNVRRRSHDALVRSYSGKANDEDDSLMRQAGEVLSPGEVAQHRELADIVDGLLAEIPEEQRMTFTLHHYSGLSLPEVAEVMDTNVATTKSRLRLAREKLQKRLKEMGVMSPVADV